MCNIREEETIMPETSLEERVVKLEQLVDTLWQQVSLSAHKKDWRRTAGMFDDDPLMKEIIEEGQRVRAADRRKTGV